MALNNLLNLQQVTDNSKTLIDHIYCNTPINIISVDVPILGLSDHFPIFATRKFNSLSGVKKSHFTISHRSFKNFNKQEFCSDVKSIPWDIIKMFDDTNDVVETWSSLFLDIADKHLPLKQHRVKHQQQPKWLFFPYHGNPALQEHVYFHGGMW